MYECVYKGTRVHIHVLSHLHSGNPYNYANQTQSAKKHWKVVRILYLLHRKANPKEMCLFYLRKQMPANMFQTLLTSWLLNAAWQPYLWLSLTCESSLLSTFTRLSACFISSLCLVLSFRHDSIPLPIRFSSP